MRENGKIAREKAAIRMDFANAAGRFRILVAIGHDYHDHHDHHRHSHDDDHDVGEWCHSAAARLSLSHLHFKTFTLTLSHFHTFTL